MHDLGVYIHIPFCSAKCCYCDFVSFSGMEHLHELYVNRLLDEIRTANVRQITTVYIGGGTPTVLHAGLLHKILTCVSDLPIAREAEFTIEINPGTVTRDYLQVIRASGISRLSFGLQSTCNSKLSIIGRLHTYEQFLENYFCARDIGFDNINVDLMFGLPCQTVCDYEKTLIKILNLNPQHISFYSLTPSEGTPLLNDLISGRLSLPDDELDRKMYHLTTDLLAKYGFNHYEISNAALPGYECIHNVNCWQHRPYIGFGLGASSFDGQRRWSNPSNFTDYFSGVKPEIQFLSKDELISEAMILRLRFLSGVNESLFESEYGIKPSVVYYNQIDKLVANGLIECSTGQIRLTSLGLDLANQVFMCFLPEGKS